MDAADITPLGMDIPKTPGWRPEWPNLTLADLDLPEYALHEIRDRFSLDTPLGRIDSLTNEGLHNGRIPANYGPQTPRWIGSLRNAIEQIKHSYPSFAPHVDLPVSPEINYALLGEAIAFYKARGYTYVEAPWAVSEKSVAVTCPNPQYTALVPHLGALVGSAEQSFLHLDLAGKLGTGRFVACTPCVRIGDAEDDLHFPTFMKVELYQNGAAGMFDLIKIMDDAGAFFREIGAPADDLSAPTNGDGWDIALNGIEIGSYGARVHALEDGSNHLWLYGTGLALPRFEQALAMSSASA